MRLHLFVLLLAVAACKTNEQAVETVPSDSTRYTEVHRPQIHFSPEANWMNDPNGLVFHNNEYHLFYQYYPEGMKWGPMHWGHAVSKDLYRWENLPIALYPDSLGLIFSGSAVVDKDNTSGFGAEQKPPLVAIFTYHSMEKEKAGDTDYQNQGIAFSTDDGRTWTKYEKNPVLRNQGIKDFRDPKVFWYEEDKKWIMTLAVLDHIEFWSSPDLKQWTKLSDFGKNLGAHGGVWECPDLFELKIEGEQESKWVLLVSINPGGPNGGSATQFFTGDFDGKSFSPDKESSEIKWIDHGPDNYAGVTYFGAPDDRKIFLGWMSNWAYGQEVPTHPWRSAMTAPRDLTLKRINGKLFVKSEVTKTYAQFGSEIQKIQGITVDGTTQITEAGDVSKSIVTAVVDAKDFQFNIENDLGESVSVGLDTKNNRYYIDRSKSGKIDFSKNYVLKVYAPRITNASTINVTMIVDVASIEVFFDDGVTVMTSVFFPNSPLTKLSVEGKGLGVDEITVAKMQVIW